MAIKRKHFEDVESAMAALPVPVESRPLVRETIRGIKYDEIWINDANGYVALSHRGDKVSAYINRGFVDVLDGPDYVRTTLPGFVVREGGVRREAVREAEVARCPVHHMALPANGVCDDCA